MARRPVPEKRLIQALIAELKGRSLSELLDVLRRIEERYKNLQDRMEEDPQVFRLPYRAPDSGYYYPDPQYLARLVEACDMDDKEIAQLLGIQPATFSTYVTPMGSANHIDAPYCVQFTLETLACNQLMDYLRRPETRQMHARASRRTRRWKKAPKNTGTDGNSNDFRQTNGGIQPSSNK